jgi:hypothetical protein
MNIGMREKTRDEAFVEAINYWAERAEDYADSYSDLKSRVDVFVSQVAPPDDND